MTLKQRLRIGEETVPVKVSRLIATTLDPAARNDRGFGKHDSS